MLGNDTISNLTLGFIILLALTTLVDCTLPNDLIIATSVPGSGESSSVVEDISDLSTLLQPQQSALVSSSVESFSVAANATLGKWKADVEYQPISWNPGTRVTTNITLSFPKELFSKLKNIHPDIDRVSILITAERDFDSHGLQRTPWDYLVSTLLTPGGLPIEGGGMSALSRFSGSSFRTPVDIMLEAPIASFREDGEDPKWYKGTVLASFDLPRDLPPGIYRLRMDVGFKSEKSWYTYYGFGSDQNWYNFNGEGIGSVYPWEQDISNLYSPPIAASGTDNTGKKINGSEIQRRCYWVLLWGHNSNGYQGVIADEDKELVAISPRNIIHDEVILPRFAPEGYPIEYNLEPHFLLDDIDPRRNIPWRYDRGEWSIKMTFPNGTAVDLWSPKVKLPIPNGTKLDLGSAKFVGKSWSGPTTNNAVFTSWKPPAYGRYTVEAKGWIEDEFGNRYYGGGNYSFWIAKRLTIATATFQGQPYDVGNRYGRDVALSPPVPADMTIEANLYVNSDPNNVETVVSTGKATSGGLFGAAQGMKYLPLDKPGEYYAKIIATFWDHEGSLWVGAMRHAGVVFAENSSLTAHGKKIKVGQELVDRGETHFEGFMAKNGTHYLDHINYPYNSGDALLIASEQQYSNKIVPVLTYEEKGINTSNDPFLQDIGRSNLGIRTSNGLSPDMFPEYITDMAYYYASAPRPGLMGRFIVAQDNAAFSYWQVSPNDFGGQYGASNNGDLPGDIYRLLGGVVLRPKDKTPMYGGYQASAFVLPKGSNNNRVIGPGDEDLPSPDGKPARFFLVSARPGMVYDLGTNFSAVLQIDPILPCSVRFALEAPDGSEMVSNGIGDRFGYFVSKEKWPLDQPGVWKYSVNASWNGYEGRVPGLPDEGGYIYVLENDNSSGPGMTLNLSGEQTFSPTYGLNIQGNSSATHVYFAAITPGAILEEGIIPVTDGRFVFKFDPKRMANKIKTYDIINLANGRPEIGRIVHLTFFSRENGANGPYSSFVRVILRGTTAIYTKER